MTLDDSIQGFRLRVLREAQRPLPSGINPLGTPPLSVCENVRQIPNVAS